MSGLIDWIQSYWYELGSLALQFAILAVVVSFGRKALRLLAVPFAASRAASQAQVELLQDLEKLAETPASKPPAQPKAEAAFGGVGRMLSPMPEAPTPNHDQAAGFAPHGSPWHAIISWLQAPMGNHPEPAWRRITRRVS